MALSAGRGARRPGPSAPGPAEERGCQIQPICRDRNRSQVNGSGKSAAAAGARRGGGVGEAGPLSEAAPGCPRAGGSGRGLPGAGVSGSRSASARPHRGRAALLLRRGRCPRACTSWGKPSEGNARLGLVPSQLSSKVRRDGTRRGGAAGMSWDALKGQRLCP